MVKYESTHQKPDVRQLPQDLTLGPEVARQFADAMALLYQRPVDPATIASADLAGLFCLQEARGASTPLGLILPSASCQALVEDSATIDHVLPSVQSAQASLHTRFATALQALIIKA